MTVSDARVPSSDLPLTLTTLGGETLVAAPSRGRAESGDGAPAAVLRPGKPLALLTDLCCSPRRTASREHLVNLLWADLEPDKARHALRQTIWYLRQILGSEGITAHGAELTLTAAIRMDRDDFLAVGGIGDLVAAAQLYGGDFLADFAAPGRVEFEHGADMERQRLRVAFLRVAERLVRDWLDGGRFREARQLARQVRDTAPGSEAAWRLLLEALLASGEQLALTLESATLSALLATEGREPEPATRVLLQREESEGSPVVGTGRTFVPALVGREREFSAVIAAWGRVGRHGGHHLHLSASPEVNSGSGPFGRSADSIRSASAKRRVTDRPFALALGYASFETKVLHGPLEIWQGVREDVQWELPDHHLHWPNPGAFANVTEAPEAAHLTPSPFLP